MPNKRIKAAHFMCSTRNPLRALLAAYSRRNTFNMNRVLFLAWVYLFSAGAAVSAGTATQEPDPAIEAHLSSIAQPTRTLHVSADKLQFKNKKIRNIRVVGTLSDADVYSLLNLVASQPGVSLGGSTPWQISMVGDTTYARVSYGFGCGKLCGAGGHDFFTHESTLWRYLYGITWVADATYNNRVKYVSVAHPTAQELRSFAAAYAERWASEK